MFRSNLSHPGSTMTSTTTLFCDSFLKWRRKPRSAVTRCPGASLIFFVAVHTESAPSTASKVSLKRVWQWIGLRRENPVDDTRPTAVGGSCFLRVANRVVGGAWIPWGGQTCSPLPSTARHSLETLNTLT